MKSGMRGGKPRDMATFKKGGTSRGAGAAKKGFDYAIYKKGGSIKKYQGGGALRDKETGDYLRDPQTGTRQYASFGDWMKDLKREFGGKSEKAETPRVTPKPMEEERAEAAAAADEYRRKLPIEREALPAPRPALRPARRIPSPPPPAPSGAFDPVRQAAMEREEASRRSRRQTIYPDRPDIREFESRAQRSMRPAMPVPPTDYYAKGGVVKKAGGGSCRGMGAAQRGGKYTIK
jgi:hypothetical protein